MHKDASQTTDQSRFELLLPFYLNKTLTSEDLAFVEAFIAAHPQTIHNIQFAIKIRQVVLETTNNRNQNVPLERLLTSLNPPQKVGVIKRILAKLSSWGISLPLFIALLVIAGQGAGYVIHNLSWFNTTAQSSVLNETPHLSVTVKEGADLAAISLIAEQYGGRIIRSTASSDLGKVLISIFDKAKIPSLIETLMNSGLIESAAVLM